MRYRDCVLAAIAASGLAVAACASHQPASPPAAPTTASDNKAPPAEQKSTASVLAHHLAAFGERNIEAILADYSEDAVMVTPMGTVRGRAQLEGVFLGLFEEFGKPGATFSMGKTLVDREVAYITWSAETADNVYEFATDTFVVVDGKIVSQTFAGKITPKNKPSGVAAKTANIPPAPGPTQEVLSRHLGAFGARDIDKIMSDYTQDSVLLSNMGPFAGKLDLTNLFKGWFVEFGKPGTTFQMHHLIVEGDLALIVWSAETADNRYDWSTDTFVIRNGKIAYQTLAAKVTPKS